MKSEEPLTGDAGMLVAQGETLMRLENETMMQVAKQSPRNEQKVLEGALAELDLAPEEAALAFYTIPYRDSRADGTTKVVNITGPSIKAAMALARRWGNAAVRARVLREDAAGWDLEGVFMDYESKFLVARPQRVMKSYKSRRGQVVMLTIDRQVTAFQAGVSKAIRNAIIAGLPAYLVSAYDKKARALAAGKEEGPVADKVRAAILAAFAERWKATPEQLVRYTELPLAAWTASTVADLRGLYNALADGQVDAEEVFAEPEGAAVAKAATALDQLAAPPGTAPEGAQAAPGPTISGGGATQVSPPAAELVSERASLVQDIRRAFEILKWKPEVSQHLLKRRLGTTDYGNAMLAGLQALRKEVVQAAEKQSGKPWPM